MPKLADVEHCTGCTACVAVCGQNCISMFEMSDGFLYPLIDNNKCLNCKKCEKICPVLNVPSKSKYKVEAYAAISLNDDVRLDSSSGGVFSEIARIVLSKNGIVYGAAYDETYKVSHIAVTDMQQLELLRGAKYSQSNLQNVFYEIKNNLNQKKMVLFSGTPCQVEGLLAFLGRKYENLITVDFACHGVPSPMAWKEYVRYRSKQDNDGKFPVFINMRSKHTGWSRYQYSNLFQYESNEYSSKSGDDLFMNLFVGDYINRKVCSDCKFKGHQRNSDMTLGDFWGIWDIMPEMDDNKGTSLLLIQSEKGKTIFEECSENLKFYSVTLSQASRNNPSLIRSSRANSKRDTVFKMINEGEFEECIKVLNENNRSMKSNFISIAYRIVRRIRKK